MVKQIVCVVFLLLFGAGSVFGQKDDKDKELKRQIEEWQKQDGETGKIFDSRNETLKFLLPKDANGWVIQIVTTGGFAGKGLPTLTLTSNGSLFSSQDRDCSPPVEIELTEIQKVEIETLEKLSQIINPVAKEIAKINRTDSKESEKTIGALCSDCYQTQIYIARRESRGDIKIYASESKNTLFSSENFKSLHQIIMKLAGYQS
jgi:virulence-associated protein VagC